MRAERAEPGLAPGGLWRVRVGADGRGVASGRLTMAGAASTAAEDASWCTATGGTVRIYDGDSGELVAMLP